MDPKDTINRESARPGERDGAGNAAAKAAGNGAESATGGQGGKGTGQVPIAALHEERGKRKSAEDENRRLREQLAQMIARKTEQGDVVQGAQSLEVDGGEFALTQADLDSGDVKAMNAKLAKRDAALVARVLAQANGQVQQAMAATATRGDVERLLGRFEIFQDPNEPDVANDAKLAALRSIEELPKGATLDDVSAAVESVAKRYSRYLVARQLATDGDGAGTAEEVTPFGGGGSPEAAHRKDDLPAPKTMSDARSLSQKVLERFLKNGKK